MVTAMAAQPWTQAADDVMLDIRLTPRGGRDAIEGIERRADGRAVLKARVRAAPFEGAANEALRRLIARALGVAPGQVDVTAGATGRVKRLHIAGDPRSLCAIAGMAHRGKRMSARIIDGKAIAAELRAAVGTETRRLTEAYGLVPGLAVVLVGDNPASKTYVGSKSRAVVEAGMRPFDHHLTADASERELLDLVRRLNVDSAVHGILVQMPLPPQIDAARIIAAVNPDKDVDGFHPLNAGRLASGLPALAPCTPVGCIKLAKTLHASLAGLDAVVIGRSNIVGKPLAQLLLAENATVTIAHSRTRELPALCRRADLLFAAIGRAEMVRGDWIKPGATVIDVGINRVPDGEKSKIVGDVCFAEAAAVAGAITPVPGGVGPMTIACLLVNTLRAACMQAGLPAPAL